MTYPSLLVPDCGAMIVRFHADGNLITKGSAPASSYLGLFNDADDGNPNPSFRINQSADVSVVKVWEITYEVYNENYPHLRFTSDSTEKFQINVKNPCDEPRTIVGPKSLNSDYELTYYVTRSSTTVEHDASYEPRFSSSCSICPNLQFSLLVVNQNGSLKPITDPFSDLSGIAQYVSGSTALQVQTNDEFYLGKYTIKVEIAIVGYLHTTKVVDFELDLRPCEIY